MNPIHRIDSAMLDGLFQKLADWLTDLTGKSCFWLARVLLGAFLIVHTAEFIFVKEGGNSIEKIFFLGIAYISIWVIAKLETMERKRFLSAATTIRNSFRNNIIWKLVRVGFVLMIVILLPRKMILLAYAGHWSAIFYQSGPLMFLVGLWFAACIPKPPKPKIVRVPAHGALA